MVHRSLDLRGALEKTRSAFLFGPRGVGKTWLCRTFLDQNRPCLEIDLLRYDVYTRYLTQPGAFRRDVEGAIPARGRLTVFVDEIQRIPVLLNEVHSLLESAPQRVRFLLTGSSARKLRRGGANLLAGRAVVLHLHPLTHLEDSQGLERALRYGTLPGMMREKDPSDRLASYVEVYLKEEIQQEALVRKVESYVRFMDVAAQMNGEPLNFSSIARDVGVDSKTAQEFVSILEDTLVVTRIDGWSWSVRKQLSHSPKIYFFDCGILNAVRGELKAGLRPSSFGYGKLFETYLIQEIVRFNDYTKSGYRMFYWRTNVGTEVDLVLSRGPSDRPIAIEIKSSPLPANKDVVGLKAFAGDNPTARLMCLCQTPHYYKVDNVEFFPWKEGLSDLFRTGRMPPQGRKRGK